MKENLGLVSEELERAVQCGFTTSLMIDSKFYFVEDEFWSVGSRLLSNGATTGRPESGSLLICFAPAATTLFNLRSGSCFPDCET